MGRGKTHTISSQKVPLVDEQGAASTAVHAEVTFSLPEHHKGTAKSGKADILMVKEIAVLVIILRIQGISTEDYRCQGVKKVSHIHWFLFLIRSRIVPATATAAALSII
jgi:hypothetical protein